MSEVELTYLCNVYVTVDTYTGEVTNVSIYDEGVRQDPEAASFGGPELQRAYDMAENTDWPEWRFG